MDNFCMLLEEDIKRVLTVYYNECCSYIQENIKDEQERTELLRQEKVKLIHSFGVGDDGITVMKDLRIFNPFIVMVSFVPFLLHDIGRFLQIAIIRNQSDKLIKCKFQNIKDHGQLGKKILKDKLYILKFLPNTRLFDFYIWNVVGYHVQEQGDLPRFFNAPIDINDKAFLEEDIEKIFRKGNKNLLKLISYVIKIVKDVDRVDIYRQIINGDLIPNMNPDKKDGSIHQDIFDMFYSGGYLSRPKITEQNKWTTNTSQLLWWSFLYHTNLVSTLKIIKEENMLDKMWTQTKAHEIDELKEAYEFTKVLLDSLINTSENGILTNPSEAINKAREYIGIKPLIRKL